MAGKMFNFNPTDYAEQFARDGYVHIRGGVTQEFYDKMVRQVEENMRTKRMKEFAIGDKQQAMYQFPEDGADYASELCAAVGAVVGLDADAMVLSERHVKAYDADAAPEPNAHKDRYASQVSVGLSVHVREGSTLVLYPHDELEVNPFNTSVQLRASMSPDQYPEPRLKAGGRRVEIKDAARDVIIFRGHKIWHLRANPANTTMLYFKMNAFHCDPLGEDRRTEAFRDETLKAAESADTDLEAAVPVLGRRVDYVHRMYTRDWREIAGVVLWGEKHFTVDEDELRMMRAMDGRRTVGSIATSAATAGTDRAAMLGKVRRLARRGVLDLITPANLRRGRTAADGDGEVMPTGHDVLEAAGDPAPLRPVASVPV